MKTNEVRVLEQMKKNLRSEINSLQSKIDLLDQLMENGSVELPDTKEERSKRKTHKRSPNSIYSRIQKIMEENPNHEYTTHSLTEELQERWSEDYGDRTNFIAIVSAVMNSKNSQTGWFSKEKIKGKWHFRVVKIQKTA